ncbi:putative cytochrome P450 monooxygenase [Setomelanomma holmii]|uniref:Cytochrome P450 monooxygenase n=1 Tax=Setomelanomma holmii TaxID=210430 RepID=A0A9P4H4I6_9PLEO|nr:putative cytochrome P450 monooxygenase [Setomelanomma holmii]
MYTLPAAILVEALAIALLFELFTSYIRKPAAIKAPVVGHRSWLEPTFLVRLRFLTGAQDILTRAYRKHKDGMFMVRRLDADILVMSNRYLEEIRLLPYTVLSNVHAQYKNIKGNYTFADAVLKSDLHTRVLRNQLTPKLPYYVERSKEEFDYAFNDDFPQAEAAAWKEVDIQNIARTVVARMTGVVFLGHPTCRNEDWLRISVQYPMDTFQTAFTLRMFPTFMHPFLARLLPSRRRLVRHKQQAKEILTPLIEKHNVKTLAGGQDIGSLLDWMLDNATGDEADPTEMTSRQLILTLASIHTTALAITHALFDLCAHPEYLEPLRQEIEEVTKEYKDVDFLHQGLPRLEKLDSFLAESQRFHPPVLMAPQRVALKSIKLRSGMQIPQGTRVAFPAFNILMDPDVTPNPDRFDAFRAYNLRESTGRCRDFMVQSDKDHLVFGHGKQACPGRYFAAAELKIVLSRLLTEYDFRFVESKPTPRTFFLDENCYLDPAANLMLRRRVK